MVDATQMDAETGLVVEVPGADRVLGEWRKRLDPFAALGVPAHVTVLFPFLASTEIDQRIAEDLAAAIATQPAFDYNFDRLGWFGDEVLWLAPSDPEPFTRLTDAVLELFPHCLPYGGAYDEIVPHLTLGHKCDPADLQVAAEEIEPLLPLTGRAEKVSLLVPTDNTFRRQWAFPLAP